MSETKRVLLVEDQQILQQLMMFELQGQGFDVTTKSNGLEALNCIEQQDFDVVVTDLFMPEMGGIELIERVKEIKPDLPFIALSASRQEEIKQQLNTLGVPNFIDKPITDDKLVLLGHLIEAM